MKDHSAHSGGSPEAPKNESPIAQEERMRVRWRTKRGLSRPRGSPGGLEQADLVWVGGFSLSCFVLSSGFGEKESLGYPTMAARARPGSEMGILRKARRCPARGSGKAAAIALRTPCSDL